MMETDGEMRSGKMERRVSLVELRKRKMEAWVVGVGFEVVESMKELVLEGELQWERRVGEEDGGYGGCEGHSRRNIGG